MPKPGVGTLAKARVAWPKVHGPDPQGARRGKTPMALWPILDVRHAATLRHATMGTMAPGASLSFSPVVPPVPYLPQRGVAMKGVGEVGEGGVDASGVRVGTTPRPPTGCAGWARNPKRPPKSHFVCTKRIAIPLCGTSGTGFCAEFQPRAYARARCNRQTDRWTQTETAELSCRLTDRQAD